MMVSILCKTEAIDSSPKYQLYKTTAIFCRHKSHRRKTEHLLLSSGQYTTRGYWHVKSSHLSVKELFPAQITAEAAPHIINRMHTDIYHSIKMKLGSFWLFSSSLWIEGWLCGSQDWWSVFLRQTSEPKKLANLSLEGCWVYEEAPLCNICQFTALLDTFLKHLWKESTF